MNDLIQTGFDYATLPVDAALNARAAAERIKLRLKRTVEDIIEIGRELTEVKADLPHGQFLPWIAAEFEMQERTAYNFMDVSNRFGDKLAIIANLKPTILYALAAPSTPDTVVEKAIEKAEAGEKVTVADVKDWKAELEAERQAREIAERRVQEFGQESNERRKTIRTLEQQIDLLKAQSAPAPEKVVVAPDDYETTKAKAAKLESELEMLKREQAKLVNSQVKAKLHEYQAEVDEMEQRKSILQDKVDRMKDYLASLDRETRRLEVHQQVIEENRLHLISLAAFLSDEEAVQDEDTLKRWRALADMLMEAHNAVRLYVGERRPELTVIRGDAA